MSVAAILALVFQLVPEVLKAVEAALAASKAGAAEMPSEVHAELQKAVDLHKSKE